MSCSFICSTISSHFDRRPLTFQAESQNELVSFAAVDVGGGGVRGRGARLGEIGDLGEDIVFTIVADGDAGKVTASEFVPSVSDGQGPGMVAEELLVSVACPLGTMRPLRIINLSLPAKASSSLNFLSTSCCAWVKSGLKKMFSEFSLSDGDFRLIANMVRRLMEDFSLTRKRRGRPLLVGRPRRSQAMKSEASRGMPILHSFLANVLRYVRYMLSAVCLLSVVCL